MNESRNNESEPNSFREELKSNIKDIHHGKHGSVVASKAGSRANFSSSQQSKA